ncbi:hypothetical protein D3C76_1833440 [compost metagenome]
MRQQPPGRIVLERPEPIMTDQPLGQALLEGNEPRADGPLKGAHGQADDTEQQ